MIKKRIKRFILKSKDDLKGLWASQPGQLLTLSYDYAPSVLEGSPYKKMIEDAVEEFNRIGLAKLIYQPANMGVYLKANPPDGKDLRLKHGNPIRFSSYAVAVNKSNPVCGTQNNVFLYDEKLFFEDFFSENKTLPPFSEISCNIQHEFLQRFGSGGILHEINHLFGIKHSHMLEETNEILAINITKPEFRDLNKNNFSKMITVYRYGSFLQTSNYSLISPFSIQHYRITLLESYRYFNRTRMSELLDLYQVRAEVKDNYFDLLDKYAGRFFLYTYQDILALASAIYHIAPDSLAGKEFNFLNYHLIKGMPIPEEDKLKFIEVINVLSLAENVSYPILLQETSTEPCFITFLVNTTSNLESNHNLANLSNPIEQVSQLDPLSNLAKQLTYCIMMPLYQGVIEGIVDSSCLHAHLKSGVKLLPRITLWYFNYFNPEHFFLIASVSFLESSIKNSLKDNKINKSIKKLISIAIFLGITELEYGFSNLWQLTDQLLFWPELSDKFNQLFLQLFFSPMIKITSYALTVNLINNCLPSVPQVQKSKSRTAAPLLRGENEGGLENSIPMKSSFVAAMQDAYRCVFSGKSLKLFSFFTTDLKSEPKVLSAARVTIDLTSS